MDFLLDVNVSGAVARWLIDRGHNVEEVGQTRFTRAITGQITRQKGFMRPGGDIDSSLTMVLIKNVLFFCLTCYVVQIIFYVQC